MRLPLAAHLKELDSAPLLTVDGNLERQVGLGHADESVDAVNGMELGVQVTRFVLLLAQLQHGRLGLLLLGGVAHAEAVHLLRRKLGD